MNILYAIQGTGNGHVCRAMDIVPALQRKAMVDVLVSGTQADVELPFPVTYRFRGLSFIFGKKGGVDLLQTYRKARLRSLVKEVKSLPVEAYDLVISDFEPVSSWACYLKNIPCIALSHQAAVLEKKSPQPKKADAIGKAILKTYAPASVKYGFHFQAYTPNIFTPVIRQQVRKAPVGNRGHYTVYLPAYSDRRIIRVLSQCKGVRWEVFTKHFHKDTSVDNIRMFPLDNDRFIESMAASEGVLCGAGFETPAEALYLGKKLLVIPMKNQFEQHCNAAALKEMGVPVMKSLKEKHLAMLEEWLQHGKIIPVDYPDYTDQIVSDLLDKHLLRMALSPGFPAQGSYDTDPFTAGHLRSRTLKKILSKL